jgi:hypothetical protein
VRQRGRAIYSGKILGGSASVLAVLATIIMSAHTHTHWALGLKEVILNSKLFWNDFILRHFFSDVGICFVFIDTFDVEVL